ncbi:MAG: hypothetical protein IT252_17105 [Chitinophagaceae bacterium]|nr:hypothetical protein [Chitinophagaceae bacterium]
MEKGIFFAMKSKSQDNSFRADPIFSDYPSNRRDFADKLAEGILDSFHFPIKFVQDRGKRLYDFLNTSWVGMYLVSSKFRDVLLENNVTGWCSYDIELYDKKGEPVLGYYGFAVNGRVGETTFSEDTLIERRIVPTGPLCSFYIGKFFDINLWDGSEIFLSPNSREIYCTKRVADLLTETKCTHLYFEDITEIQVAKFLVS